jgi:hypothetical protein
MHVKGSWARLVQRFHRAYVAPYHKNSVELTLLTNMPTNSVTCQHDLPTLGNIPYYDRLILIAKTRE